VSFLRVGNLDAVSARGRARRRGAMSSAGTTRGSRAASTPRGSRACSSRGRRRTGSAARMRWAWSAARGEDQHEHQSGQAGCAGGDELDAARTAPARARRRTSGNRVRHGCKASEDRPARRR